MKHKFTFITGYSCDGIEKLAYKYFNKFKYDIDKDIEFTSTLTSEQFNSGKRLFLEFWPEIDGGRPVPDHEQPEVLNKLIGSMDGMNKNQQVIITFLSNIFIYQLTILVIDGILNAKDVGLIYIDENGKESEFEIIKYPNGSVGFTPLFYRMRDKTINKLQSKIVKHNFKDIWGSSEI